MRQELRIEDVAPVACLDHSIADVGVLLFGIGWVEPPESYAGGDMKSDVSWWDRKRDECDTHVVSSPPLNSRSPSLAQLSAFTQLSHMSATERVD